MFNFKKEEERYQQIQYIKSVLADFRTYDIVRQAQIDLMYHFNVFFIPIQEIALRETDKLSLKIKNPCIGFRVPYNKIAHLTTEIAYDNSITARFSKEYTFQGITFVISDYLTAEIPEEELTLLELLGKVEVTIEEAQPSKTTKTIFCPNPDSNSTSILNSNGIPF